MQKKQLITALITILFLSGCSSVPAKPFRLSKHTDSNYEYDKKNLPEICFFPVEKARWDGYNVTNKNWNQLTEVQKFMFVTEAADEIQRNEKVAVDLKGGWGVLIDMNNAIMDRENYPDRLEFPMIKVMYKALKDADQIKPDITQEDVSQKSNSGNPRISEDVLISTIGKTDFKELR